MKKIWIMIQNEAVKLFKRKTTIALVLAIIVFCAAVPVINYQFHPNRYNNMKEMEQTEKANIERQLSGLKDTSYEKVQKASLQAQKQKLEIMAASEIESGLWRDLIGESYFQSLIKVKMIELIDGGTTKMDLESLNYYDAQEADKIYNMNSDARQKEKNYYVGVAQKMEEYIRNKNWSSFFATETTNLQTQIDKKKEELKNPEHRLIINIENELLALEIQKKVCEYIMDNKVSLGDDSQSETIVAIYEQAPNMQYPISTENEYIEQNMYRSNMPPYEDYVKMEKARLQNGKEQIEEYWYALEKGITPMNANIVESGWGISSARMQAYNATNIFISVLIAFTIIISAGIIASEYSKKTMTSLLIYCPNRLKLICAKMLFVLITAIITAIVGIAIIQISSGFAAGFKDFFVPVIEYVNGSVKEQSFFMYTIRQVAIGFLPMMALAAITLLLSVLTKNTAVAVAVPLIISLTSSALTYILLDFGQTWVLKSFIPYFKLHELSGLNWNLQTSYYVQVDFNPGVIWMIAITLICTLGIVYKIKTDDV